MSKVVVMNSVTLDGVMQGPGGPDEDTRGGFAHGGWAVPGSDELMVTKMAERMGENQAFLFGRRTYEDVLASWNAQGGPFKDALNKTQKYVASRSSATRLEWPNSTLLHGDILAAVAELKQTSIGHLAIMGSGELIAELMRWRTPPSGAVSTARPTPVPPRLATDPLAAMPLPLVELTKRVGSSWSQVTRTTRT
jgi:dihydrofolate reductase